MAATALVPMVWRSWARTFGAVPRLLVPFLLTVAALDLLDRSFDGTLSGVIHAVQAPQARPRPAAALLSVTLRAILFAPLMVLLIRRILKRQPLSITGFFTVTLHYVAWTCLLDLLQPLLLLAVGNAHGLAAAVANASAEIALAVLNMRLLPLLPAVAVERSDGEPHRSWRRTRGRFWRLLGCVALLELPFALPLIVVTSFAAVRHADLSLVPGLIEVTEVLSVLMAMCWVAFSAQLWAVPASDPGRDLPSS